MINFKMIQMIKNYLILNKMHPNKKKKTYKIKIQNKKKMMGNTSNLFSELL